MALSERDQVVAAIRKMDDDDLADLITIEEGDSPADAADDVDVTGDDGAKFTIAAVHVTLAPHP